MDDYLRADFLKADFLRADLNLTINYPLDYFAINLNFDVLRPNCPYV